MNNQSKKILRPKNMTTGNNNILSQYIAPIESKKMKTMSELNATRENLKDRNRNSNVFASIRSPQNNDTSYVAKIQKY